jgi:hypothetical protein
MAGLWIRVVLLLLGACSSVSRVPLLREPAQTSAHASQVGVRVPTALPLRDSLLLQKPKKEKVLRLTQARVVIADYELLRRDFPHLRMLNNVEVDQWLLSQTAYISKPQVAQTVVNTSIPTEAMIDRMALRPEGYGRALVYPVTNTLDEHVGLIDVKGAGALEPSQSSHGNGLSSLGEVMREYIFENLSRDVLTDANSEVKTIGSYAVIDAGFDVVHADGSQSRAGLYLRQASERHTAGFYRQRPLEQHIKGVFERVGVKLEEGNVQVTSRGYLIDFGHYYVSEELNPKIPFHVWGYDPSLTIPQELWSRSRYDFPWIWSHQLAEAWAAGAADRHVAYLHVQNFLEPARAVLDLSTRPEAPLKFRAELCKDMLGSLVGP